jgi:uncharacterized protein YifE (UPF0438 family)
MIIITITNAAIKYEKSFKKYLRKVFGKCRVHTLFFIPALIEGGCKAQIAVKEDVKTN